MQFSRDLQFSHAQITCQPHELVGFSVRRDHLSTHRPLFFFSNDLSCYKLDQGNVYKLGEVLLQKGGGVKKISCNMICVTKKIQVSSKKPQVFSPIIGSNTFTAKILF